MRNVTKVLALAYAVIVGLAALWAWYTDVTLLHSGREHMLPGLLLVIVSLPTSKTLDLLYEHWPAFFSQPFVQLSWTTACGMFQALVLYFASRLRPRERSGA
ncbi:SCO4225 family membrane protein [Mangrovitalea sediminis]